MMYRARRLSGAALAITMLFAALALALSASAEAQEDQTMEVSLTESRDSGVSGSATLEDVKGGVEVTLQMRDLPEARIEHRGRGGPSGDRLRGSGPLTGHRRHPACDSVPRGSDLGLGCCGGAFH